MLKVAVIGNCYALKDFYALARRRVVKLKFIIVKDCNTTLT